MFDNELVNWLLIILVIIILYKLLFGSNEGFGASVRSQCSGFASDITTAQESGNNQEAYDIYSSQFTGEGLCSRYNAEWLIGNGITTLPTNPSAGATDDSSVATDDSSTVVATDDSSTVVATDDSSDVADSSVATDDSSVASSVVTDDSSNVVDDLAATVTTSVPVAHNALSHTKYLTLVGKVNAMREKINSAKASVNGGITDFKSSDVISSLGTKIVNYSSRVSALKDALTDAASPTEEEAKSPYLDTLSDGWFVKIYKGDFGDIEITDNQLLRKFNKGVNVSKMWRVTDFCNDGQSTSLKVKKGSGESQVDLGVDGAVISAMGYLPITNDGKAKYTLTGPSGGNKLYYKILSSDFFNDPRNIGGAWIPVGSTALDFKKGDIVLFRYDVIMVKGNSPSCINVQYLNENGLGGNASRFGKTGIKSCLLWNNLGVADTPVITGSNIPFTAVKPGWAVVVMDLITKPTNVKLAKSVIGKYHGIGAQEGTYGLAILSKGRSTFEDRVMEGVRHIKFPWSTDPLTGAAATSGSVPALSLVGDKRVSLTKKDHMGLSARCFVVIPETGDIKFKVRTDDGAAMYYRPVSIAHMTNYSENNNDAWINIYEGRNMYKPQGPTIYEETIQFDKGKIIELSFEWYEQAGGATAEVYWSINGADYKPIEPPDIFYHPKMWKATIGYKKEWTALTGDTWTTLNTNTLLGNPYIHRDFTLEFDLMLTGTNTQGWMEIMRGSFTNRNCCQSGDRMPGLWLHNNSRRFHSSYGSTEAGNQTINNTENMPENKLIKYKLTIKGNDMDMLVTADNYESKESRNIGMTRYSGVTNFFLRAKSINDSIVVKVKNIKLTNLFDYNDSAMSGDSCPAEFPHASSDANMCFTDNALIASPVAALSATSDVRVGDVTTKWARKKWCAKKNHLDSNVNIKTLVDNKHGFTCGHSPLSEESSIDSDSDSE